MSSLSIADSRGRAQLIGTLGGGVSYDGLAINDRLQIAWTVLAGEPLKFQAYMCQLEWP